MYKLIIGFLVLFLLASCTENNTDSGTKKTPSISNIFVPTIDYTIVDRLPHDITSFTEGLVFNNQQLFESTGSPSNLPETKSMFGVVDLKTGKINPKVELDRSKYFGEGIVFFNDKIYQLTYTNQIGFIYDSKTYKKLGQFNFKNKEGWGLTTDGTFLIMSDGTNNLTYLDPNTLKVVKTISVNNAGYAEDYLNELEYIRGYIYANIWTKNYLVKIDPQNGKVIGTINLSPLTEEAKIKNPTADVLNGIAYNSTSDKIYVTGKLWANIFQIDFPH